MALDALRGFDMFWIVGGREFALALATALAGSAPTWIQRQLDHAAWEGFTAWDLIMPLFLFVVGAAMPFSFARRIEDGASKLQLLGKMMRRAAVLFLLGMVVQGNLLDFRLSTLHVYCNTLQAIAAGYAAAGLLMLTVGAWGQATAAALLLVGYWLIMTYVPVGELGAGSLRPDANVALMVDEWVLGPFRDGTPYTWVLSSMTFTATVLLGVLAGHVLRSHHAPSAKFFIIAMMGLAALASGWFWSSCLHFPIIKHLWTSSMVLWSAGWSYLLLALFYLLIDIAGWRRWAFPLVVIGVNAITIYVAYWFIPFRAIGESLVGGLARHAGAAGPVVIAFATLLLVWLMLYHLYRQRIFLRV